MTNFVWVVIERTPITCFSNVLDLLYKDKWWLIYVSVCVTCPWIFLYGYTNLSVQQNVKMFLIVRDYIIKTTRFFLIYATLHINVIILKCPRCSGCVLQTCTNMIVLKYRFSLFLSLSYLFYFSSVYSNHCLA